MKDGPAVQQILKQVRDDLDLSLADLLELLRRRTGYSIFRLASIAGVDSSAFNKVVNAKEGRLLHHDNIECLVQGLVEDRKLPPAPRDPNPNNETSLWLMALQCAAAADAQITLIRRYNRTAIEEAVCRARRQLVTTLRAIWLDTGGTLPMPLPPHPIKENIATARTLLSDIQALLATLKSYYPHTYPDLLDHISSSLSRLYAEMRSICSLLIDWQPSNGSRNLHLIDHSRNATRHCVDAIAHCTQEIERIRHEVRPDGSAGRFFSVFDETFSTVNTTLEILETFIESEEQNQQLKE
jgi:hypothetical protein